MGKSEIIFITVVIILIVALVIGKQESNDDELAAKVTILQRDAGLSSQITQSAGRAYTLSDLKIISCEESSDQKSITVKYTLGSKNKGIVIDDECDNNILQKTYCLQNNPAIAKINCQNGCEDSKCVPVE